MRLIMSLLNNAKRLIELELDKGNKDFIIFPFGDVGMRVKTILNEVYNIDAKYILDNHLCKYNKEIKALTFLKEVDCSKYVAILATTNTDIYDDVKSELLKYIDINNIVSLISEPEPDYSSVIGKYSYGPLLDQIKMGQEWIESVGAFCSFAYGTQCVQNHTMSAITTHPIAYFGGENDELHVKKYKDVKNETWYSDGIMPKGKLKCKKSIIGNDVWLGRNVIITNGANIGNGVIAAAGAVITKDIPDYAVVAGVPARIIRYRYTAEQIEHLNQIKWWDWTDEEIIERQDDLSLPIDEFIKKYL